MRHWELDLLIDPEKFEIAEEFFQDSSAVHLYNELLIRAAIPKNVLPPKGSFLYHKFSRHLPQYDNLTILGSDWLRGWRRNYRERKIVNKFAQVLGPIKTPIKRIVRLNF